MRRLTLPVPPSTNALFNPVKGRLIKSKEYRAWEEEALWLHKLTHKEPLGLKRYEARIEANLNWRRDLPNVEKALNDLLEKTGEVQNDRYLCKLTMERVDDLPADQVRLTWLAWSE